VFNNTGPQIEHMTKKIQNTKKKKNKTKCPQINQQRSLNIFGIFCYRKGAHLAKYQTRMGIKIMAKA
jgi:cellobiose-specific phosphotransferase system component IIB